MAASFLEDGYQTLVTFAAGSLDMEEITAQAPGLDAGEKINTTTMRNAALRTAALRKLADVTDGQLTVKYKVTMYTQVLAMLGVNQLITFTFADTSTVAFWGGVNSFVPGEKVEGTMPTATIAICATNRDASGAETPPAVVEAA